MRHDPKRRPPPGGRGGPGNTSCAASVDGPPIASNPAHPQASILRLVRPPRPRRLDCRIAASDGRAPIGRSRIFRLTESGLDVLIACAERLEPRR